MSQELEKMEGENLGSKLEELGELLAERDLILQNLRGLNYMRHSTEDYVSLPQMIKDRGYTKGFMLKYLEMKSKHYDKCLKYPELFDMVRLVRLSRVLGMDVRDFMRYLYEVRGGDNKDFDLHSKPKKARYKSKIKRIVKMKKRYVGVCLCTD